MVATTLSAFHATICISLRCLKLLYIVHVNSCMVVYFFANGKCLLLSTNQTRQSEMADLARRATSVCTKFQCLLLSTNQKITAFSCFIWLNKLCILFP